MQQADLFPAPIRRRREDIIFEFAFSQEVQTAIMHILEVRPGCWLDWEDYRPVMDKYEIGFCLGHVLSRMARVGLIQQKNVYFGSETVGPDYLGFKSVYMIPLEK
jgi:hypothetical protein